MNQQDVAAPDTRGRPGRKASGQVIVRTTKDGPTSFSIRFTAYGKRHQLALGPQVTTRTQADEELANILADVRRGTWRPPSRQPVESAGSEPTFHQFASEWYASKESHGLAERTLEDLRWGLSYHLLPWFENHRLSEITRQEVDRFRDFKAREGVLAPNTINKVLQMLSAVLETAVEYELVPLNAARGRNRRLPGTKPRRPFVQPEQLMALIEAAEPFLKGRGRPLLAVLAGAGLRIEEALTLTRQDVDLARGSLSVVKSKTDAGVRVVDLTPALRDELALWLDRLPSTAPTDLVFPTHRGLRDTRHNVRKGLLLKAVAKANEKLTQMGIAPIPNISPHALRRTFTTLRGACGDDPVYTANQLGHTDPTFTLRVYAQAYRHRSKLTPVEREAFDAAVNWAQMGADPPIVLVTGSLGEGPVEPEVADLQGLQAVGSRTNK